MPKDNQSYPQPGEVQQGNYCAVCRGVSADPNAPIVVWKNRADGSGRPITVHKYHIDNKEPALSTIGLLPQLGVTDPDANDNDDTWAFAASFKYINATSKTNVPAIHEDSTIQQTFPQAAVPTVQPATRVSAGEEYSDNGTGAPIPPDK